MNKMVESIKGALGGKGKGKEEEDLLGSFEEFLGGEKLPLSTIIDLSLGVREAATLINSKGVTLTDLIVGAMKVQAAVTTSNGSKQGVTLPEALKEIGEVMRGINERSDACFRAVHLLTNPKYPVN